MATFFTIFTNPPEGIVERLTDVYPDFQEALPGVYTFTHDEREMTVQHLFRQSIYALELGDTYGFKWFSPVDVEGRNDWLPEDKAAVLQELRAL